MDKMKMVLVDDEVEILRALERELLDFSDERNIELYKFDSPLQGLSYIELHHDTVALVISDQKMPLMKGCDFLEKVKEINSSIVSILLTAHTDIDDIIKTVRTGLFSFVLKPWERQPFLLEVEKGLNLYTVTKEKEDYARKLNEELMWGGELQKLLLSNHLPVSQRIDFSVCYKPVPDLYCGGDYYDVISFSEDLFMVLIGDVAGHGVKAAFVTFIIKTLISEVLGKGRSGSYFKPAELLKWLNNRICQELNNTSAILVTFCASLIDLKNQTITVSNGGHIPPVILRDGALISVESEGTALGFQTDLDYSNRVEALSPGDQVLFYTDGLLEADLVNASLEEIFLSTKGGENYSSDVVNRIERNMLNSNRVDDMTLVSVEIQGS